MHEKTVKLLETDIKEKNSKIENILKENTQQHQKVKKGYLIERVMIWNGMS